MLKWAKALVPQHGQSSMVIIVALVIVIVIAITIAFVIAVVIALVRVIGKVKCLVYKTGL